MRLMSRNLVIELPGDSAMGYELDWDVQGALIVAVPAQPEDPMPPVLQSPVSGA